MARTWPSPPPLTEAEPFLPEPDGREREAVFDELDGLSTVVLDIDDDLNVSERPFDHVDALQTVGPLVETLLEVVPTPAVFAALLNACPFPMVPELIALQTAFGAHTSRQEMDHLARLVDRATRRGLSVDGYVERLRRDDAVPDTATARLLRGESRRRPDDMRMRRGIRFLRHAAALGDDVEQAHLFCAIGWLHWARGQRALAQSYFSAALRRIPDHPIAWGFSVMAGAGLPKWVTRPSG